MDSTLHNSLTSSGALHAPDGCENEPIHIPGCIQQFGILLTIDVHDFSIQNISENCANYWGVNARDLIGTSFSELINKEDVIKLRTYLSSSDLKDQVPLSINLPSLGGKLRETWELSAHVKFGVLIIELEPIPKVQLSASSLPFHRRIREAVQALQRAKTLTELCNQAAFEVKNITGFDRVMIYRFDKDWHGVVVAEACDPNVDSYLGHHFPASDIPPQARQIFINNWLRMIPDVAYVPSPILPGLHPQEKTSLDLSESRLRSVSPIHLEYLRNMNVQASLTVSLIDEGKLWGLIACHHNTPLRLRSDDTLGAQLIGQLVSSQLRVKESQEYLAEALNLQAAKATLISQLENASDLAEGFASNADAILNFGEATGVALFYAGEWTLLGTVPSVDQLDELRNWLATKVTDAPFVTNALSKSFPTAEEFRAAASGLLCVPIPTMKNGFAIWFRPEFAATVVWAGKPGKTSNPDLPSGGLRPRASFESWTEIVTGQSKPWSSTQIDAFESLRNGLLAVDLKFQFDREQAARAEAEKVNREKDDVVAIVSHDLKMPLNTVKLSFDLLARGGKDLPSRTKELIDRGARATQNMEQLIVDILDITKIESGTLTLDIERQDVTELVKEVVDFITPLAAAKFLTLTAHIPETQVFAKCERNRIFQVLSNLVSNAIKFTPPNGSVTLTLENNKEFVLFHIADTGPGIEKENFENVFDRFWQAHEVRRLGTGLGLSIAKGIVEKHGGRIWVESELGKGSHFFVSLPAG